MLLLACLYVILCLPMLGAQSPTTFSERLLDSLLQDYAFRAFDRRPRTGIVFDANVPSNLTGVEISALRLRSGSLRKRGIRSYKQFDIPIGVIEQPSVDRLALVYHNLGNWSSLYYPLPGYTYLAPVVGLLAYDASNLSATDVLDLDIRASEKPILVKFPNVQLAPSDGVVSPTPMCVYFDVYGSVEFDNVMRGNVCSAIKQGHFSIVVESTASPSPAPAVEIRRHSGEGARVKREKFIILGSVVVGVVVVVLLATWVRKCRRRERVQKFEEAEQGGVPLSLTSIGSMKVPVANVTRTRPRLENEYYVV